MRGATIAEVAKILGFKISIHTPHAGSDHNEYDQGYHRQISIHTPHAGSDNA